MKRKTPDRVYEGLPCSVVAMGTAMNTIDKVVISRLFSTTLHEDGYLSLRDMNALIRSNLDVSRQIKFKRGERPALRDWAHENLGNRAVVCVFGHYLYFDGRDYHSFLWNGGDPVVSVWYLK